jgi:hypothetical protein
MRRPIGHIATPVMAFGAIALIVMIPFAATGSGATSRSVAPAGSTSACPSPSPWDTNSSLYPQICGLPAFQALLDRWGASNFSWGMTSTPTWNVVWLTFDWVAACDNSSLAAEYGGCEYQEYWGANITSGAISGPTMWEGPVTCACPTSSPGVANPWTPEIVAVGAVAAVAALGVVAWRRRRRPPETAATPGLSPPP